MSNIGSWATLSSRRKTRCSGTHQILNTPGLHPKHSDREPGFQTRSGAGGSQGNQSTAPNSPTWGSYKCRGPGGRDVILTGEDEPEGRRERSGGTTAQSRASTVSASNSSENRVRYGNCRALWATPHVLPQLHSGAVHFSTVWAFIHKTYKETRPGRSKMCCGPCRALRKFPLKSNCFPPNKA